MAQIPGLLVNGARADWASILLTVQGTLIPVNLPIIGENAINYDGEMDGQLVHGAARQPIGKTLGQWSGNASITFYKDTYMALIGSLASQGAFTETSGYMEAFFDLTLSYNLTPSAPLISDRLIGCTIKKESEAHKLGGEALTVTVDLQPTIIQKNGQMPTSDANLRGVLLGLPISPGQTLTF